MKYEVAYQQVSLFTPLDGQKTAYYCTLFCFSVYQPYWQYSNDPFYFQYKNYLGTLGVNICGSLLFKYSILYNYLPGFLNI
jgi:hypothetical protein